MKQPGAGPGLDAPLFLSRKVQEKSGSSEKLVPGLVKGIEL